MGEQVNNTTEKASKRSSWFKGLKSEFKKIVWIDRDTLTKQSVVVLIITVFLGIIIFILDYFINLGIGLIL